MKNILIHKYKRLKNNGRIPNLIQVIVLLMKHNKYLEVLMTNYLKFKKNMINVVKQKKY